MRGAHQRSVLARKSIVVELLWYNVAERSAGISDGHDFARIDLYSNEHGVVFHEVPFLYHLVGNESGEPEAEGIGLATGSLEVLPCRIRYETLDDITRLLRHHRLVEYGEGHAVRERPSQQSVVLPGKDLYVYGDVASFTGAVSI